MCSARSSSVRTLALLTQASSASVVSLIPLFSAMGLGKVGARKCWPTSSKKAFISSGVCISLSRGIGSLSERFPKGWRPDKAISMYSMQLQSHGGHCKDDNFPAQIVEAERRGTEMAKTEPRARTARFDASTGHIVVELVNGCTFAFPARLAQGLE